MAGLLSASLVSQSAVVNLGICIPLSLFVEVMSNTVAPLGVVVLIPTWALRVKDTAKNPK